LIISFCRQLPQSGISQQNPFQKARKKRFFFLFSHKVFRRKTSSSWDEVVQRWRTTA